LAGSHGEPDHSVTPDQNEDPWTQHFMQSRAKQGLSTRIEDPVVIARIIGLLKTPAGHEDDGQGSSEPSAQAQ